MDYRAISIFFPSFLYFSQFSPRGGARVEARELSAGRGVTALLPWVACLKYHSECGLNQQEETR